MTRADWLDLLDRVTLVLLAAGIAGAIGFFGGVVWMHGLYCSTPPQATCEARR